MLTPSDVADEIRRLLDAERLAMLSTEQRGQPYASLVAFSQADDLATLLFATPRTTRKFANLQANPKVALLIDNSRNQASDIYGAVAVTAIGRAAVLSARDRKDMDPVHLAKHPYLKDFLRAATTDLVRVAVTRYLMVRNFQNVYDYKVYPCNGS